MGLEQGTVDGPLYTQTMGALRGNPAYTLSRSDGTYAAAYCLNHEKLATDGTGYTWEDLGQDRRADVIGTILAHGFQYSGKPSGEYAWGRGDSNDKWLVTQLLVWATCNGHIFIQGNHVIGFEAAVDEDMKKIAPYAYNPSGFLAYYNQLKATITKSRLIPSFASYPAELDLKATAAKPIVLRWDGSKFTATVTDTNGVLANFNFRNSIPGVTCSVSGNQLTLSTDKPIPEAITSSTVSYRAQGGRGAVAVWRTNSHDSSQQDFAVYTSGYDPILAQLTVKTEGDTTQSAKLVKTSEDGKVGGITFRIAGSDGSAYTKVTDSAGNIEIEELKIYDASGKPITYTATEDTPEGYEPTRPQSFTLTSGKAVVAFTNKLKRGALEVTKTSEDGLTAGVKFHLYGTSTTGQAVDMTATTDASGVARLADVPVGTGYVLEEVQAPYGYVLTSEPVPFDVVQEDSEVEGSISVIVVELTNAPQKGTISVGKTGEVFASVTESDGVYQPVYSVQGLPGAVYEITAAEDIVTLDGTVRYMAGELVDTVTTDASGSAKSKALYLGQYTVTETKAPFGMILNAEPHHVHVTTDGEIVIEDVAEFKHLIPGKEYTITGVLMDKSTGMPLTVDDKEIRSEVTFTPETADGEVTVQFTFDAAGLTTATEVVVFETLYREGVEIAVHADIEDEEQTVTLTPPAPPTPNVPDTGDSGLEMWLVLFISALLGAAVYAAFRGPAHL